MELALARRCLCARCHAPFLICSHCDRGQRYCGPLCSSMARRAAQRAAGARYQGSRCGRHTHAARQRRYRERHRDSPPEKVTHQGSPPPPLADGMSPEPTMPPHPVDDTAPSTPMAEPRCRFCGRPCAELCRLDFLRHRQAPRTVHYPVARGDRHDPSP
ncbi:MAG: hypothetical protein KJ558_01965 [Gammaproteobacteria bacterium]|nr:hypothetical protein [Gammaproteobacteria bacterium]MBU1653595.1 hypothetical protein [Gammaproteobacteria bacterium]MBU1960601.1 hypothetical protein [Gammaproteobacteria bacterium]